MSQSQITVFGEVLFDRFADGVDVLGGAPFNVAWHLQAFAQQPLFISRVGCDATGEQVRVAMQAWGMAVSGLQSDTAHPTGAVAVTVAEGQPQYAILPEQAYDYILPDAAWPISQVLYHGSLALRQTVSRLSLQSLKQRHQGQIFVDVNLRTPWWQLVEIEALFEDADWLKLNDEELQWLRPGPASVKDKLQQLQQQYQLQAVVLTCGEQGAAAVTAQGEWLEVKPAAEVTVVDTVGAGDAFAAVLLLGIAKAWPLAVSLPRAQAFASALVGQRGATVQDRGFYQPFIADWL